MPTEETPDLHKESAEAEAEPEGNRIDVVEGPPARLFSSSHVRSDGFGDDVAELSDETVGRLLSEAEERMKSSSKTLSTSFSTNRSKTLMTKFPKLNPGASLPKAPIKSQGAVSRISDPSLLVPSSDRKLANTSAAAGGVSLVDPALSKKRLKEDKEKTAGLKWFDMPRTNLTPEFKRDLQLIKMRGVLDPHRHYKKDNSSFPEYSHVGTIVEGNADYFSSRLRNKERKRTIAEEVMADDSSRKRFKNKYEEIQRKKRSGKKEFYKKLKQQRKKSSV
ncbi:Fcf2 pre-rRNA processing-domain-containing protein [Tuber indicum]|nr:Fcf2 pre-rRNA processing-domain-containing protein [Tuber indicum]